MFCFRLRPAPETGGRWVELRASDFLGLELDATGRYQLRLRLRKGEGRREAERGGPQKPVDIAQ